MHTGWTGIFLLAELALAGCQQAEPQRNTTRVANAIEQSGDQCAPPNLALALADGNRFGSQLMLETKANFTTAYERACNKGLLKDKSLVDPKATNPNELFLINASDANDASIYLSEVDGNKMVLEYPFLTTDGKTQIPSDDELEKAIYCAVIGATPEEQESSGRCLVD